MTYITTKKLHEYLLLNKRKFEGLFPELIKKLIINSCPDISGLRMPGRDDIWAPGFDGIVENNEENRFVSSGKSVWEFGTNANSLAKINKDYQKRTNNSLGIDKSETTFYLVIPRIWAYDNQGMSISKWETEHKNEWHSVHVYDASILCDWINSDPAVCAWLFEQYADDNCLLFPSITGGWNSFSNLTAPPFTRSMFLEGREEKNLEFQNSLHKKVCRVKSDTFVDAYGFCLAALIQNPEINNNIVVVKNEKTYIQLARDMILN